MFLVLIDGAHQQCALHGPCMLLPFSSPVTVKGAMECRFQCQGSEWGFFDTEALCTQDCDSWNKTGFISSDTGIALC